MKLTGNALEEQVIALLCFSNEHAPVIALRLRDQSLFANETWKKLADTSIEFVRKYSCSPNGQLKLILEDSLHRGAEGTLLEKEIDRLRTLPVHPQFVIESLDNFIETKQLQQSLIDSMELLDRGDLAEAKENLYKRVSIPQKGSPGILLNDPKQALSFLDKQEEGDFFSSGVEVLDYRGIRPERKTLLFLIAASGKGKSWFLTELGKAGLQHHHNVLHITLELSEEKCARRYIQSIFSLNRDETQQIQIPRFERNEFGHVTSISMQTLERNSILSKRKEICTALENMRCKLFIKEFPTGSLSTEHLSLYLDSLERDLHFKPSLLCIDYADLMKVDSEALRVDLGRLYRELRGIAVSRNIAIVSASQGNRESESAKLVSSTNISEDWSKVCTADIVLTYSQTPDEKRLGLARIFVSKGRDAADRFIVLISQAYCFGQFVVDSIPMNPEIINQIQGMSGQSTG